MVYLVTNVCIGNIYCVCHCTKNNVVRLAQTPRLELKVFRAQNGMVIILVCCYRRLH